MIRSWRLRLLAAALVLCAFAVSFVALSDVIDDDEEVMPSECPACEKMTEAEAQQELARRYVPIVHLRHQEHECDKYGEGYSPLPVEIVLGNPEINLRKRSDRAFVKAGPTAADLVDAGPDAYLDLPGNPKHPGCTYERDGRRFGNGQPNVTYVHIATEPEIEALALQYWFFYYFNDANNKHEGDWEMIQLAFDEAATAKEALAGPPDRIGLSQHSGGEVALWTDGKLRRDGNHPIVFVAVGSQANYFGPHLYVGRAEQGAGFGCDDSSGPGTRVALEPRLIPEARTGPADPYAWVDYRGRWGELAGPEFDGPTGPITKRQWISPFAWEEDLRQSSVRVPSRDTIGPNGVEAFCELVAGLSDLLLPVYLQLGNIVLVGVGIAAAGSLATLTRTRYIPIVARPLQARRRIGQILLSALEIYRRRLRLFLGIGLAFVPIALLVSLLHWLVLSVSPVESLTPIPSAKNVVQELIWAIALSEMQFGLAYAIVVAATTATLASIERGGSIGMRDAYRLIWGKKWQLALPRLAAIGLIVALGTTIVGLPLAMILAVRWTFIEQAVLLDGQPGRRAPGVSSRIVAADWRWAAAASIALGALGLAAAPALAIVVLLLFRDVPLSYVNLMSSLIYVALVPYVAIALALVYFDLKERPASGADVR